MTITEKKTHPLGVGDDVSTYDDGSDGHPRKVAYGEVIEVGDETFVVQWKDLEDPTEYEWSKIDIEGNRIYDPKRNKISITIKRNIMKTQLDITKLLEKTEQLCHDGRIELAEIGEVLIQIMESDNGDKYLLKVSLSMIYPEDVKYYEKYLNNTAV